ncbi:hypothetical protein KKB83_00485 [Patescibacteria group bacterium]|nr:hypothetical protein [Patescibacteria group bacterium]
MVQTKRNTKSLFIDLALILLICGLNVYLVFPLFKGEYTQYLQSIEVNFFTMARFFSKFWVGVSTGWPRMAGWNPLWYLGFPMYVLYTPLMALLEILINGLAPAISLARAYRLLAAASYCLVPVSLYIFVSIITKKRLAATVAAVAFSVLPSVNYLLVGEVRDVASGFSMAPWRLIILTLYGEGPHTMAQVFILLAAAAYHRLLEKGSFGWTVGTAFLVMLTGFTNAIGFFALVILFLVMGFAEVLMERSGEVRAKKIRISWQVMLLSYGFLAFWYNLAFISDFLGEGEGILQNYLAFFPWGLVLIGLLAGGVYALLLKVRNIGLRIALLWFGVGVFLVLAHYNWGIDYAPQALRYMAEVDMAAAILMGLAVVYVSGLVRGHRLIRSIWTAVVLLSVLAGMFFISRGFLNARRKITAPGKDIKHSAEYEIAQWLDNNLERDERVYVSGNYAFWLNHFKDIPQVRGSLDQANIHPWTLHASYQIVKGESGEISTDWLKIMNVGYVVVDTVTSRNSFKDYAEPGKFEGILEEVYRKDGDIVYKIPLKNNGLAKAVDLEVGENLIEPFNAIDEEMINEYVDWLERGRGLEFRKVDNYYQIEGDLVEGEAVLVQMTYHSGWKAYANEKRLRVGPDVLGFILIEPDQSGHIIVDLKYTKTIWLYVGYGITAGSVGWVIYRLIAGLRGGNKKSGELNDS